MSSSPTRAEYQEHFRQAEVAAEWLLRLETEGQGCHADFVTWLRESPLHVREFCALSTLSKHLETMDPRRTLDVEAWLADARVNVVALHEEREAHSAAPAKSDLRKPVRMWRWAGVTATIVVISFVAYWALRLFTVPAFTTSIGEQRTMKLADGSLLVLNTRSHVEVKFKEKSREVRLLEGEALFVVAHDVKRPFRVAAGGAVIQAVGTQFNVRRKLSTTEVSVIEGRVQVSPDNNARLPTGSEAPPRLLVAGEEAVVSPDGRILKQTAAAPSTALAWRQRRLVFRDNTLADVAAEFNRYNETQIRVEGDGARNRLLTGAFEADNPQGLILFLRQDESLETKDEGKTVVIRAHRPALQ